MASFDIDDTIAAIASPPGQGVRGILRLSGPATVESVANLFQAEDGRSVVNLTASAAIEGQMLVDPEVVLPGTLLIWPDRRSYTRQPTAEFHTIGSPPLLHMALAKVCRSGVRLANPGEFTLRAFLSGRIDLTQAEAVLAVIDSTGERQLNSALRQLAGGLAGPLGEIRDELMSVLAELEAGLDFVEEDIEFISADELAGHLERIAHQLDSVNQQVLQRGVLADNVKVVLVGEPNSGKSSLFNAMVGSDQAIVTNVAGTTTDFISAKLEWNGALIELVDTAGFEHSDEAVANQAQTHRSEQQSQASVTLFCIDASRPVTSWERTQLECLTPGSIVVLTKTDLMDERPDSDWIDRFLGDSVEHSVIATSCQDSTGIQQLREEVAESVFQFDPSEHAVVTSTLLRATESLVSATQSVHRALDATQQLLGEEVVSAEIRQALEGLGQVVGAVYTDDILDLVFGRFCIGK